MKRNIIFTVLFGLTTALYAQDAEFIITDFFADSCNKEKTISSVQKAIANSKTKYGEYSINYEKDLKKAVSVYYSINKEDMAQSLINEYLNSFHKYSERLLKDGAISKEMFAAGLCLEFQSWGYVYESCCDTLNALRTYHKCIEPFIKLNLHNLDYADALFYSGVNECRWGNKYGERASRIKELTLLESSVHEYIASNASDSLLIDRMLYISDCVYATLRTLTVEQRNKNADSFSNAIECIDIWKRCLDAFNQALGDTVVDKILIQKSKDNLENWAQSTPFYEYAIKMHIIEPYWDSCNNNAIELHRIKFYIREGLISEAMQLLDKQIRIICPVGPTTLDFIDNLNLGYIKYIIEEDGPTKAIQCLNDWFNNTKDPYVNNENRIVSELIFFIAKQMEVSGYTLEAKDLYHSLYTTGHYERDLSGIDPYDEICEQLYSLSNIHYETVRTNLAKIKNQLNSLNWGNLISKEILNTNFEQYKDPYNYVRDCITLSDLYSLDNNYDEAISTMMQCESVLHCLDPLAVETQVEEDQRPVIYNRIGIMYSYQNNIVTAMEYWEKASAYNYIPAIDNLGSAYYYIGDFQKAIDYLEIRRQFYGVEFSEELSLAYAHVGNYEKARELGYERLNDKRSKDLELLFKMSASERRSYPFGYQIGVYCVQYPEAFGELCYDSYLYSKSIELHCVQTIKNLFNSHKELSSQYNALFDWDNLLGRSFVTVQRGFYENLYQTVKSEGGINEYTLSWRDVQSQLKKGDVAIEFFQYYELEDTQTDKYGAAVLTDKERPIVIKLQISDELHNFLKQEDMGYRSIETSSSLFNAIWGQIVPYLTKGKNVYYSPDGLLRQVNMECLYTTNRQNARFAGDEYKLKRLSSTRELCISKPQQNFETAILYGNLQYDMSTDDMSSIHNTYSNYAMNIEDNRVFSRGSEMQLLRNLTIPLNNTEQEVAVISNMLESHNISSEVIQGIHGVEETFKSLSGTSPNILHLATHGFYLPETSTSHELYYASNDTTDDLFSINPMNRSGIILSGAKKAIEGEITDSFEDGILLASEIALMDLTNTDIIVLSACQTGLGDLKRGEIYGLQRGFKLAGAQTLIMSLWNVNDRATAEFMIIFYKNLLAGKSKTDSFNTARRIMYKQYPNNSEYWAAFIMLD